MGYAVEQLQLTEAYLSDFATDEAVTGYHTAAEPGGGPAAAGRGPPGARRAAPDRAERGGPADLGAAARGAPGDGREGRVPGLPPRAGVDLGRGPLPARRAPARQLLDRPRGSGGCGARGLGRPDGQPGRARVHPDREPAVAEEPAPQRGRQHRRRPQPQLRLHVGHAQHQHLQPRPVGRDLRGPAGVLRAGGPRRAQPRRPPALRRRAELPQLLAARPVPVGLHRRPDRGRGRPRRAERARRGHAAADQGRARRDLHRPAGVAALPDGRGHHRLGLRRVRGALVHHRAARRPPRWTAGSSCRRAQIRPCLEENRPAALEFIRHVFERPEAAES